LAARVGELGAEISRDYAARDPLLVTVLKGAFVFAADLARAVTIPHAMDFLVLAGYGGDLGGRTRIRLLKDLELPIAGRDVLLVENVVDTGLTLNYVVKTLALRDPGSIAICTLFDRPYRRLVDDLPMRYVGFTIPDQFFLGYGFDLHERYRGLPDVHALEE
jgi:hypoxanthine phosphoribosyltransferase